MNSISHKPKRICILNYTGSSQHIGCLTACYALEKGIKSIFGKETIIDPIPVNVHPPSFSIPSSASEFEDLVDAIRDWGSYTKPISEADCVIFNAEGTLHWPTNNLRVWVWLALVEIAVRDFNKPMSLINGSIFSDDPIFLGFCQRVLGLASHAAVRDSLSMETLSNLGIKTAIQAADLTFLTNPNMSEAVRKHIENKRGEWFSHFEGISIVVSGSSAINSDNKHIWTETLKDALCLLKDTIGNLRVLFIGQLGMGIDATVMDSLADIFPGMIIPMSDDIVPTEAVAILNHADLIISGRFHVNTLSIVANRPVVMLPANTQKNRELLEHLDKSRYAFVDKLDAKLIAEESKRILASPQPEEIRQTFYKLACRNIEILNPQCKYSAGQDIVDFSELLNQYEHLWQTKLLRTQSQHPFMDAVIYPERRRHHALLLLQQVRAQVLRRDKQMLNHLLWNIYHTKAYRYALALQRTIGSAKHSLLTLLNRLTTWPSRNNTTGNQWPCEFKKAKFHDATIKILHIALSPLAGAPIRACHMLDNQEDVSAICVCTRKHYPDGREFDFDIVYNPVTASDADRSVLERLIEECDLIHFHNEAYFQIESLQVDIPPSKPRCIQWHSGPDAMALRINKSLQEISTWKEIPQLVIAQKHCRYYEHAIPVPNVVDIDAPDYQPMVRDPEIVRICYCPTDETLPHTIFCGDKGGEEVLRVLETIQEKYPNSVDVDIIQNVPLKDCLMRKRTCDICIDDIKSGGFHLNSLESLAMGSVVIGWLDNPMKRFLAEYVGCSINDLPWHEASTSNLEERLTELIQDKTRLKELGIKSRKWMENYWSKKILSSKYRYAYRSVMRQWKKMQPEHNVHSMRHMSLASDMFALGTTALSDTALDIFWESHKVGIARSPTEIHNTNSGDCFIIGTGPSINEIDFQQLRKKHTIGVNGAVAKFDEYGLVPRYYTITTADFFSNRFDMVKRCLELEIPSFFPFWGLSEIARQAPQNINAAPLYLIQELNKPYGAPQKDLNVFYSEIENSPSIRLHPTVRCGDRVGFSTDLSRGYFNGENVVFTALQIAYYLGYRRIFILGMDLNYSGPQPRFYEDAVDTRPNWLNDSYSRSVVPCFEIVHDMCAKGELEVYNVCPHSRLPENIIPKLSFEEAILL